MFTLPLACVAAVDYFFWLVVCPLLFSPGARPPRPRTVSSSVLKNGTYYAG